MHDDASRSDRVTARSRALTWTIRSLVLVVSFSFVAGVVAALVGGSLSDLGEGAGGLFGVPSLLTTLIAVFLALPAAVTVARHGRGSPRLRRPIVIAGGAWVVAIGYFQVAHSVDPCLHGWWDLSNRVGDQPLCERFGSELNWHTRFHLAAHAGPAMILLVAYLWAIRRWATPTDHDELAEHAPGSD
ncbi:MAG TPA: hypothetical protein VGA13_09010 [Acidimicrobiales bacterium]|jgi:hypothetical protein